jgi:hypothetical protein
MGKWRNSKLRIGHRKGFFDGVTLKSERVTPSKKSSAHYESHPQLAISLSSHVLREIQREKTVIKILLFYLIKNPHFEAMGTLWSVLLKSEVCALQRVGHSLQIRLSE